MIFIKNWLSSKNLFHKQRENEDLQAKVLDNAGNLFNELNLIYN